MSKKQSRSEVLKANTAKRHQKIKELFEQRYHNQERINGAKKFTREYIIAKLSEEYNYSMRQIENIIYAKTKEIALPAPGAPGAPDAGAALATAA